MSVRTLRYSVATVSRVLLPVAALAVVTTATLALAHRFGPDGAEAILKAPPDAKLSDILPKKVLDANPALAGLTAGQYAQTMANQFGNTSMETQAPAAGLRVGSSRSNGASASER